MKFEEEFPSLKGKLQGVQYMHSGTTDKGRLFQTEDNFLCYHEMDIKMHCLDKQCVKEAINKLKWKEYHEEYNAPITYSLDPETLLKELGLDE